MTQSFDTIKIGVCDCYWIVPPTTLVPNPPEVYLGLTKGGTDLTYTPTWYEITVDQFGKTATESVLTGEDIKVKIPLAETDLTKLSMFAHTSTLVTSGLKNKLTFGSLPGLRLENFAGQLRLHPISMGSDLSEDVIIYKAVNKAPLNLQYKVDAERIFATEFVGVVQRQSAIDELAGTAAPFLWQIGSVLSTPVAGPVLSGISSSFITATTADLNFTSSEAGTYYYLVYASSDSAPNAATIQAQGTAITKGTGAASASSNVISVTGLTTSTSYTAYVVVQDSLLNLSIEASIGILTV